MKHTLVFHTIGLGKRLQKIIGFKSDLGLSFSQAVALLVIDSQNDLSQREIASRLHLEPASIVTLIDELEKLKLLKRKSPNGDRRKYRLELTEEGKVKVKQIKTQVSKLDNFLKSKLSPKEAGLLMSTLDKLFYYTDNWGKEVKDESFSSKQPLAF